jgi:S1-C subfamily serine protease
MPVACMGMLRAVAAVTIVLLLLPVSACLSGNACAATGLSLDKAQSIKDAVVKVYSTYNPANFHEPWQMQGQQSMQGSGFIIEGNRILTNAHVVAWQTFVQVRKSGQARKYTARVEHVAHETDLALLRVEDEDFFKGIVPLRIGSLPEIRDEVGVYGFPAGGDRLGITQGVVSRIEHIVYNHSGAYLLACQIDASINVGNSGGPVLKGDEVVGVAFQGMLKRGFENVGYIIPASIVKHFLQDIEKDGVFHGTPELGLKMQKMENPALLQRFGLKPGETGALVNKVFPDSPAEGLIFQDDVVVALDGYVVEEDGTVEFRRGERTFLGYIWQQKHIGDTVNVDIVRNGERKHFTILLTKAIGMERLVPNMQYDHMPTYYIYGGLVFTPLVLNYLKEYGDEDNWRINSPVELLNYYENGEPSEKLKQVVILAKVLADDVNIGYHTYLDGVIVSVNGVNVGNLNDVIAAIENNKGAFHVFEDSKGHRLILDREQASRRGPDILRRYKILSDRSSDLSDK